jgi:hypothetical protein
VRQAGQKGVIKDQAGLENNGCTVDDIPGYWIFGTSIE